MTDGHTEQESARQIQRLERELGVRLLDRSTHHVDPTRQAPPSSSRRVRFPTTWDGPAGRAQRRHVLGPPLRVGIIDAGCETMPQILRELQHTHPDVTIHQVEAGTPEQYRQLADGCLSVYDFQYIARYK